MHLYTNQAVRERAARPWAKELPRLAKLVKDATGCDGGAFLVVFQLALECL
jgi:hypothetical protein